MSVSMPPTIDAYESGMRSFEGDVRPRSATRDDGMSIATTGVLLRNPDGIPANATVAPSCFRRSVPANDAIRSPNF